MTPVKVHTHQLITNSPSPLNLQFAFDAFASQPTAGVLIAFFAVAVELPLKNPYGLI